MRYLTKQEVRVRVADAIGDQYPDTNNVGLFQRHFNSAVNEVDGMAHIDIVDGVIKIMQAQLLAYANSKASTNGGRLGRFFAPIVSFLLPFFKFIKIKK
jgi:hypothetical protein